jgi:hypothetical protein
MPITQLSNDDVVKLGEQIYSNRLRSILEPDHDGEFLVIEVLSGEYAVDNDEIVATRRAHALVPNGMYYGVRVGRGISGKLGGSWQKV